MKKETFSENDDKRMEISRRTFCKVVAGVTLVGASSSISLFASENDTPAEPENLDVPTPWQQGDPEPVKTTIPAIEPEQSSTEAPPCQPMEDQYPEQPDADHVWVSGYWWWNNKKYVWVPGYWAVPPQKEYVYVPGYWTFKSTQWVFVRGGWAKPNTTAIVVYPKPRPVLTALVITAPIRIVRRHRLWRHYPARRVIRRVDRRHDRRKDRRRRKR